MLNRRSKVQNYVAAGRDIFRIFVGAALTPVQVLAELIQVSLAQRARKSRVSMDFIAGV